MGRHCSSVAILVALMAVGCSDNPPGKSGASQSGTSTQTVTKLPEVTPAGVELKQLKYSEFEQVVAQHKGNLVVVDFWFEQCIPCKKGLPQLAEMQKKHAKDGLTVLTVNMDDPKEQERGLAFLRSAQISLPNYAYDATDETWLKAMKLEDGITFPYVRIYDRQGKLIHDATTPHEEVEEKVGELLKK